MSAHSADIAALIAEVMRLRASLQGIASARDATTFTRDELIQEAASCLAR